MTPESTNLLLILYEAMAPYAKADSPVIVKLLLEVVPLFLPENSSLKFGSNQAYHRFRPKLIFFESRAQGDRNRNNKISDMVKDVIPSLLSFRKACTPRAHKL